MMERLKGIPNVNQFEGFFMDSVEGYIPNRISRTPLPVLVMEALQGGDLYEKLHEQGASVTENYLALAFRGIIEALQEIHRRGYIHRDLKLENLMYVSSGPDSPIKVAQCLQEPHLFL
jgi:serine/threonine protein kinase